MKSKLGAVILAALAASLLIALLVTKKQTDELRKKDAETIVEFSNQLVTASSSLNDLRQVNLVLTNDIVASHQGLEIASNSLAEAAAAIAGTKALLENAEGQITNLSTRINDLETENKALDERANSLSNAITVLNVEIAETRQKLAVSETNNTFLTFELQKQMAQKAELERKFNDLNTVRTQFKKLRDEAFSARQAQWIKDGTTPSNQPKGAQLLMRRAPPQSAPQSRSTQYDLNVEVGSDGSVHVMPPPTNSVPH
ncbi:MAG: hypothetical protein WDM80_11510 [Limisphaerales bacterium]